jgi:hypothetical protein
MSLSAVNNPFSANFPSPEFDDELMFSLVKFDQLTHPDAKMPKRRARPRELLTILPRLSQSTVLDASAFERG